MNTTINAAHKKVHEVKELPRLDEFKVYIKTGLLAFLIRINIINIGREVVIVNIIK